MKPQDRLVVPKRPAVLAGVSARKVGRACGGAKGPPGAAVLLSAEAAGCSSAAPRGEAAATEARRRALARGSVTAPLQSGQQAERSSHGSRQRAWKVCSHASRSTCRQGCKLSGQCAMRWVGRRSGQKEGEAELVGESEVMGDGSDGP